jgi:hypothetical protein
MKNIKTINKNHQEAKTLFNESALITLSSRGCSKAQALYASGAGVACGTSIPNAEDAAIAAIKKTASFLDLRNSHNLSKGLTVIAILSSSVAPFVLVIFMAR